MAIGTIEMVSFLIFDFPLCVRMIMQVGMHFLDELRSRGDRFADLFPNTLFQNPIWNSVNMRVNNTKRITKVPKYVFRFVSRILYLSIIT